MTKTVNAKDFLGTYKTFIICFETTVLHETFAVGIDASNPNNVSIFHVVNYGDDVYYHLHTCFCIFQKINYSFEEKFKKEMKKVLTEVLTARVKAGILTVEQIERWAKDERL